MKWNGRWFPRIVDWDSENLYPIYLPFPCSDFLSQGCGWEGVKFFFLKNFTFSSRFMRHVWFSHCNSKTQCCIFSKLCRYVHHVMGVCCIVFGIDGMLLEFLWIFEILKINTSISYFLHFRVLCYFQHLKKEEILRSAPSLTG